MDDDEASSVLNRLRRYAGVATGVTGVALRGAGRWIGGKGPFDIGNAADLARMLGGLRGPRRAARVGAWLVSLTAARSSRG